MEGCDILWIPLDVHHPKNSHRRRQLFLSKKRPLLHCHNPFLNVDPTNHSTISLSKPSLKFPSYQLLVSARSGELSFRRDRVTFPKSSNFDRHVTQLFRNSITRPSFLFSCTTLSICYSFLSHSHMPAREVPCGYYYVKVPIAF